jgi:hypothetical protein
MTADIEECPQVIHFIPHDDNIVAANILREVIAWVRNFAAMPNKLPPTQKQLLIFEVMQFGTGIGPRCKRFTQKTVPRYILYTGGGHKLC